MPLQIVNLPKSFRPGTSIVYPPFKKGRYLEEYVYDYLIEHQTSINTNLVYVPVFWTNLQNHPGFHRMKQSLSILLQRELNQFPASTTFFTIVQHDDGPLLPLPKQTMIFGACTGTIPIPLIYEDTTNQLQSSPKKEKKWLASFVGTSTHVVREEMVKQLEKKENICLMTKPFQEWTNQVKKSSADQFVETTLESKFCLAPRGYGRSSFRFFESILLDTIPVYIWDDKEWLPYQDRIDYSLFSISMQQKNLHKLYNVMESISEETYKQMLEELKKHRSMFTLESLCEYIRDKIEHD
jgi:hypothetical protein